MHAPRQAGCTQGQGRQGQLCALQPPPATEARADDRARSCQRVGVRHLVVPRLRDLPGARPLVHELLPRFQELQGQEMSAAGQRIAPLQLLAERHASGRLA